MLEGKIIIVAGGTGGIGMETCRLLAYHGASLVIAAKKSSDLEKLLNEIKVLSPESISYEGDLSLLSNWERLVENTVRKFRHVDSLINCVGVLIPAPFDRLKESEIQSIVGANFLSAVFGIKTVLPVMKQQKEGHIIQVGSLGGIVPMPFQALYSATKFAVRGFSLSLNEEFKGTGVHLSLIEPGAVRTKMLDVETIYDRTTITFVNPPFEAFEVSRAILSILKSPRREVILPRALGKLVAGLGFFPNLFAVIYPLINLLGSRGLKNYKKKFLLRHNLQKNGSFNRVNFNRRKQ